MRKQKLRGPFVAIILLVGVAWSIDAEDDPVLERIVTMNHFSGNFRGSIKITSVAPGRATSESSLRMYVQALGTVLLDYVAPAKDVGKKILLRDGKIWFYFPRAGSVILMNQASTVSGTLSIGDVTMPPLLDYYDFQSAEPIKVGTSNLTAYTFLAKKGAAPYGKVIYYYDGANISHSESFSRSGILLKRSWFDDYVEIAAGVYYASHIKVESGLSAGTYSLIEISALKETGAIPGWYFTPDGMGNVRE